MKTTRASALVLALVGSVLLGCGDDDGGPVDAAIGPDAGASDAGDRRDAAPIDAGDADDAGTDDGGALDDAGTDDGGALDDAGTHDAGASDGGTLDGGSDAGTSLGPTPGPGDLVIVEIQGNPQNTGDDQAEYIELLNVSGRALELQGVSLAHVQWTGGEPERSTGHHLIAESVPVAPGARVLLTRSRGGYFGGATIDHVYDGFDLGNGAAARDRLRVMVPAWDGSEPPAPSDVIDEVRTAAGAFANPLRGRAIQLDPDAVPSPSAEGNDDPANWCHAAAVPALAYWMSNWGTPGAPNRCD